MSQWLIIFSGGPYSYVGDLLMIAEANTVKQAYDKAWKYVKSDPFGLPDIFRELFISTDPLGHAPLKKTDFNVIEKSEDRYTATTGPNSGLVKIFKLPEVADSDNPKLIAYLP